MEWQIADNASNRERNATQRQETETELGGGYRKLDRGLGTFPRAPGVVGKLWARREAPGEGGEEQREGPGRCRSAIELGGSISGHWTAGGRGNGMEIRRRGRRCWLLAARSLLVRACACLCLGARGRRALGSPAPSMAHSMHAIPPPGGRTARCSLMTLPRRPSRPPSSSTIGALA